MDSRVLSQAEVIAVSRKFICVRPLTYEDKVEADYLRQVFNRRGALENTVFAILDPSAKTYLAAPGRSPEFSFPELDESIGAFAGALSKLAEPFKQVQKPSTLPEVRDLRYGLNVAACDRRPMAYVISSDGTLQEELARLAWMEEFQGQFVYVKAKPHDDVSKLGQVSAGSKIVFAQPDEYGVTGTILGTHASKGELAESMRTALRLFKPWTLDHRTHLANAVRQGIRWRTVIPEEDRNAATAVERLWGTAN